MQVLRLKKEISATVKALEAGAAVVPGPVYRTASKRGSPMSILGINPLAGNRGSTSSTTSGSGGGGIRTSTRMKRGPVSMRRTSTTMFSALTGAFHPSRRDINTADLEAGPEGEEPAPEEEPESNENDMLISEQDVDTDALNAILGLCNLYATEEMMAMESQEEGNTTATRAPPSPLKTMNSQPFSSRRGGRGGMASDGDNDTQGTETRRFGKIRFVRGQDADTDDPNIDEGEDDGWEEVQLNTSNRHSSTFRSSLSGGLGFKQRMSTMFGGLLGDNPGAERRGSSRPLPVFTSTNAVRMQGYLNKRKPGTTTVYQRRFFLLTDKQLMWFASEEDVELHINRRKGAISISSITNLDRYDPTSLCVLSIQVTSGRVYVLMAIDRSCADDWYDMIQECRTNLSKNKKIAGGTSSEVDGEDTDKPESAQASSSLFPAWFGGRAGGGAEGDEESRPSVGGAGTNYRPSLAFNLGSLGLRLGHEDIHDHVEEEGNAVTQMLRRGTTTARRGLGSIFHAASGALPLATVNTGPATETSEVWRVGWDTSDLPRKMGYMQKKGELNASWQQRWFVIGHTGNLSWFDKAGSERHQKPKGCVSMGEVVCVKGVDTDNPRLVEIRHIHGRVYQLEAGSELDAADWRSVLEKWVVSARAAIDKYNSEHNDSFVLGSNSNTTYDQDQDEEEEKIASGIDTKEPDTAGAAPSGPQRKTGFMQKRGGTRSTAWKKRWFVLDHPGVLSWYEKINGEKLGKAKGALDLAEVMCVKTASYDAPCLVEVRHVEGRVYEIEANSVQEAEEWRTALNLWLKVAYDLKKAAKTAVASAAAPAAPRKQNDFSAIDTPIDDAPAPDTPGTTVADTNGNAEAMKKRYFMYSKLGFSKSTRKPKEAYMALSAQSPAVDKAPDGANKRSPGSPVAELDELYPQLSATEMIESLTRDHAAGGSVNSSPAKSNPLFRSQQSASKKLSFEVPGEPYDMSKDLEAGTLISGDEHKVPEPPLVPFTARAGEVEESNRDEGSDDEEVAQYHSSVPFGRSNAPFTSSAQSPASDHSSRDSTPSSASPIPETQGPRSGRRARGPRRGSTAFSEICAKVAAHAPDALPAAAATEGDETVAAYNRHRSSIDNVIEERRRGAAAQPLSDQRAKRQPMKRNNLLGVVTLVENPGSTKINRRESELADSKFMRRMAKRHSSELVDNLQKRSYKDMNSEFWVTHKWYLACVVCFVTLNVLYSTSYIVSQY